MSIDLIVDDNYSLKELQSKGLQRFKYYTDKTLFSDEDGNAYVFNNTPLKRLKIRYKYEDSFKIPQHDIFTEYDREFIEEELLNCCSPARLGIDYK